MVYYYICTSVLTNCTRLSTAYNLTRIDTLMNSIVMVSVDRKRQKNARREEERLWKEKAKCSRNKEVPKTELYSWGLPSPEAVLQLGLTFSRGSVYSWGLPSPEAVYTAGAYLLQRQ